MVKSVPQKINPTGSSFLWSNAYTSRDYTCFWHVIGSDISEFLASYIKDYLSLIQNTDRYGLIDIANRGGYMRSTLNGNRTIEMEDTYDENCTHCDIFEKNEYGV